MENQAFEEEQQPRVEETVSETSNCPQKFAFQSFAAGYLANTDGHVYEDILPGVEEVSKPADIDVSRAKCSLQLSDDIVDRLSREDTARSFDGEELASPFRRNLTLPFRRATGHGPFVTRCSVRATNRRRNVHLGETATTPGNAILADDECAPSIAGAPSTALQIECKPNRKRKKKDCKHCRNKAASNDDRENETVLRKNRDNRQYHRQRYAIEMNNPQMILDPRNLSDAPVSSPVKRMNETEPVNGSNVSSVFTISEKATDSPVNVSKLVDYERNDARQKLVKSTETKGNDAITSDNEKKTGAGMRVNSIYSQDRWYTKETPMFFTDVKEHDSFQRAYSLPLRMQTPSSQNRINLRRSVRGEPPPHPARLRKHRHGWTLHLARPLETSGCTRSLVFLLIVLLTLVGIGAVALYLVFEPEKLHIIQQYLKSSTNDSSSSNTLLAETFVHSANGEESNDRTTTPANNTPVANILSSDDQSFPRNDTLLTLETETETETEATSSSTANSTRYCDDCLSEEVCVALVDEEVPICRISLDPQDPTGCAGFCLVNKQKCHRLDVDAFRCVDIEHYCLDDEWTCSNTLCIPVDKRCDGHMNCYDHSDEHNCVCDLETHFQCGNETSCLPLEKRCDGKIDCWDAADEINCTLGRNLGWSCPSDNEFTCSNGQCILKARFCDGLPDCLDGSDEPHGCQGRCNKHEFTCQNSRCIAKGMRCNGIDDCGDESDEKHCKDRIS